MNKKAMAWLLLASMVTVSLGETTAIKANASTYNYGEALQKSIMFYEFQRSGKLPEDKRDNWRGDSALNDGSEVGLDLTGGWYDAGDHIKFNLPGSYSSAMLAWSVYEDKEAYKQNGQLKYIMDAIKWENDYLMKCHPEPNVYYYQVGKKDPDHNWWGPAEAMTMERKASKADTSRPATTASAEAAASLAAAAAVFKDTDALYAATCLKHAKELFAFADNTKSDSGFDSEGCYNLDGKFYDELSWAATWIYIASGESSYLNKAEAYVPNWCYGSIPYNWCQDWQNVYNGTTLLLAKLTNKSIYKDAIEKHLDFWSGASGDKVHYAGNLACISGYGSLRYASAAAFLAGVYADWSGANSSKATTYRNFLKQQINYILGDNPQNISYEVGFGNKYPQFPHHRTAHGSWNNDNVNPTPAKERHILYGALVGGPDYNGNYEDKLLDYTRNEVACDYNAGFVGALSKMYKLYGGTPIANFNAIEEKGDEYYVESNISNSNNGVTVKAVLNNISGWPAKISDKLSFKYFVDLSEYISAGGNPDNITVSKGYAQAGNMNSKLQVWDKEKNIYYAEADFTGTKIGPGSNELYKKEINFTITAPSGTWNNSNDFSYTTSSGMNKNIAVYDDGTLVGGNEATQREPEVTVTLGDVNGDGKVTVKDYIKLQQYLLNTSVQIVSKNADMNGDGKINITDALLLKKALLA